MKYDYWDPEQVQAFCDELTRVRGGWDPAPAVAGIWNADVNLVRTEVDAFLSTIREQLGNEPITHLIIVGDEAWVEAQGADAPLQKQLSI